MADHHKLQTDGRKENAAQPLNGDKTTGTPEGGAERYPAGTAGEGVEQVSEHRSFDPERDAASTRQGAGDSSSPDSTAAEPQRQGSDPVEGKR